jgi:multiple sugar transport system substrate-binding protein
VTTVGLAACLVLPPAARNEGGGTTDVERRGSSRGRQPRRITVWARRRRGASSSKRIAADFENGQPGRRVTVTVIPFDTAHDKIATAIAGDQAPDVSQVGTTWLSEFAATGALDATPTDLIDPGRFFEGSWSTTEVDGTSFGAPWYTETRLIYYRKDLAEKAGVTPSEGWSQEDLKAFAKAMQDEAGAKWGISLQPGGTGSWQSLMPFAWQRGAEVVDGDQFSFDTPEMQEALDYYASFFSEGISPTDLARVGSSRGSSTVISVRFVSGPWHMGILADQGGPEFAGKWAWRRCRRRRQARPSPAAVIWWSSRTRRTGTRHGSSWTT